MVDTKPLVNLNSGFSHQKAYSAQRISITKDFHDESAF